MMTTFIIISKKYKICAFNNQNQQLYFIYSYPLFNIFYTFLSHRTDKFQIRSGNMGDLLRISLRNDDTGDSADWHVDKILIVDSSGKEYRFPANVWLSHDPGRQLDIMLTKGMLLLYQSVRGAQYKHTFGIFNGPRYPIRVEYKGRQGRLEHILDFAGRHSFSA